jgi:HK97 family phage major capsid protein
MADPNTTPAHFLALAQQLVLQGEYSKSKEAQVRSLMKLAEAASALVETSDKSKPSNRISYSSEEERSAWVDYLRTGRYQRRDMTSGGSGIGSTSPLVPLAFYNRVTHALKLTDQLWDPDVSTVIKTERGSPFALPMDFDTQAAATIVNENQQGATQDTTMGMVALPASPTWRTSIYGSVEFLQDSGIPLDTFLALLFAVRYARGFGQSLVATLLAGSAQTVTPAGAGASDQSMGGVTAAGTSLGSDDLIALMESLDGAYLQRASWAMAPKTYLSLMGLRSNTGNLVFIPERDADGRPLLFSRPVIFTPSLPAIGSATRSVVLGDFSRLVVRQGSSMTLQASAERRPETGSIYFWSTWRLQGAVAVDPNVAAQDRPFVTFVGTTREAQQTDSSQPEKRPVAGGTHHGHRTTR